MVRFLVRVNSVATLALAILSFMIGSFLIIYGLIQWINNLGLFGFFGLLPYAPLGALFVFMSLPIALFGFTSLPGWFAKVPDLSAGNEQQNDDESSLFSNKRVVGLSLIVTGADWLILNLFALLTARFIASYTVAACPLNGCRSILSAPATWIVLGIGVLILAAGIVLILMSKGEAGTARQEPVRASLAGLSY